ncbi:protein Gir2p [Trichomonascus vanleenenianus]|uniref:Gir2p n=1 Tax=Trichomonascus vanleenenianus TaxID=2268995 RepID=UPI003EC962A1
MSNKEEQEQEVEILQSIYPDEIEVHSDVRFTVHLRLDTPQTARKHYLALTVEYPEEYPEVVPILQLEDDDGEFFGDVDEEEEGEAALEDGDAANDILYLADKVDLDKEDRTVLHAQLMEAAEENVGMPSVFTLVSQLKEQAEELFAEKIKVKETEREQKIRAQEEKEQQKFKGTPVTPESFAAWRIKFREEFGLDKDDSLTQKDRKLTGKELFEQGLTKDEDEEELNAGVSSLAV